MLRNFFTLIVYVHHAEVAIKPDRGIFELGSSSIFGGLALSPELITDTNFQFFLTINGRAK